MYTTKAVPGMRKAVSYTHLELSDATAILFGFLILLITDTRSITGNSFINTNLTLRYMDHAELMQRHIFTLLFLFCSVYSPVFVLPAVSLLPVFCNKKKRAQKRPLFY